MTALTSIRPHPGAHRHGFAFWSVTGAIVVLNLGIAANAIWAGLDLITTNGVVLQLPPETTSVSGPRWLVLTPFTTYAIPGFILLVANGLVPLAFIALMMARSPWASAAQVVSGVIVMGWITVQVGMMGLVLCLQPVVFIWGLLMAVLGCCAGAWTSSRCRA